MKKIGSQTIKFDNPYISGRNIKTLTFSQIQTNYYLK